MADETTATASPIKTDTVKIDPPAQSFDQVASALVKPDPIKPTAPTALWAAGFKGDAPEITAADRIRAFEDQHLGKDAVRIGGRIERGSGSPFAAMDPEKKRQYAALENLADAEQKLAAAHAALIKADVEHDAALVAAEPKPDAE